MAKKDHDILIDKMGGTRAVAELCGVSPGAVSQWRNKGIPQLRQMQLRGVLSRRGLPVPRELAHA